MASAFSHAFAAFAGGKSFFGNKLGRRTLITGMVCSAIPDLDVIGFWLGVPYESLWGHRGISHSLFFAFLLSFFLTKWLSRFPSAYPAGDAAGKRFLFLFLATTSHPVMDAMTNGGLGVAFFAPFDHKRYFLPWRPIRVSPISVVHFFSGRGWEVFKSELLWIWLPATMTMGLAMALKHAKKTGRNRRL